MKTKLQSGVALVITLLMLSVITFMTVAFLAMSRRDRAAVTLTLSDKDARAMADAGLARAQAEIVVPMTTTKDLFNYDLMVSRNFIKPTGFDVLINYLDTNNVNYDFTTNGGWTTAAWVQNIANLWYDPRPPVFVKTNSNGATDFRFWVDINQNGLFEGNGLIPDVNDNGQPVDTNGVPVVISGKATSMLTLTGEPEWIGVLENPEYPHSASNFFIGRYAYLVCPVGKTLDLNYIHNYAKRLSPNMPNDGFLRNQGVGSWELNLAGYLNQLNTNLYAWGGTNYQYFTSTNTVNAGAAFDDAVSILGYRYNDNYNTLQPASDYFGWTASGRNPFACFLDMYSDGPLQNGTAGIGTNDNIKLAWSGSDNTNAFYELEELFDPNKTSTGFTSRLMGLTTSNSTYNRYTFQRLLATLGTDSSPELKGKININYTDDPNSNSSQTIFTNWTPIQFFTNTVELLLSKQFNLHITDIPIYSANGGNLYLPEYHRIMQLAANIYDATSTNEFPTVFRPLFKSINGTNYICGYTNDISSKFYRNGWANIDQYPLSKSGAFYNGNVFGIPVIVGAKKRLPNFNEVSMSDEIFAGRKLQLTKPTGDSKVISTNQMYIFGVTNSLGVELWNSYTNPVPWKTRIVVSNYADLSFTNDLGYRITNSVNIGSDVPIDKLNWPGFAGLDTQVPNNFLVPIFTNFVTLPYSLWSENAKKLFIADTNSQFEHLGGPLPLHRWTYSVTNRLFCAIIATDDNDVDRIIDFVSLSIPAASFEVMGELSGNFARWNTNLATASSSSPTRGVVQQIQSTPGSAHFIMDDTTPETEMEMVRADARVTLTRTYQANDPLVHYTLFDLAKNGIQVKIDPSEDFGRMLMTNLNSGQTDYGSIGRYNTSYQPWTLGEGTGAVTNMLFNDPNVRCSDDWDFPTNKFPNIGWLGRVHRGTPWQTLFFKSENANPVKAAADYGKWTGKLPASTYPTNDWALLDYFTTAPNDNAARGLLSVNQTNTAAWSALFSGVIVLTNSFTPGVIQPEDVSVLLNGYTNYNGISTITNIGLNEVRRSQPTGGHFIKIGDILRAQTLTVGSPFINNPVYDTNVTDDVVERIPQQIMSLLKLGQPRFVIYSYGQSLKPKEIYSDPGSNHGLCTNYWITGESVTRTVCHVEGPDNAPKIVIDSYNVLPGE